jgi:tetratricopeptide (TPR) repeat protein
VSLTAFAAARKLNTRQRLELVAKICDAVHYGHQKGIIHRDLKPANILVDASDQPRVIDFGVARVTDRDLQVTTLQTDIGQLIGTLPYMSPEQMSGNPAELDTRSDVYALGVVCYELLTARLPHDLSDKSVADAARTVRDEDPQLASAVDGRFRGDIDTILATALEKDKTRRYQSASALAADIRRYLHDEPIAARPASTFYQLRKLSRRHRAVVAGAVIAVVGLICGTAFATWKAIEATAERNRAVQAKQEVRQQAEVARIEARKAKRINTFLKDMLAAADPRQAHGWELTVREMLDKAAGRIDAELAEEPEVAAALHYTVGSTYRGLGLYAEAEPHLQSAIELHRAHTGADAPPTLDAMHALAVLYRDLDRRREAEALCRQTLEQARRAMGEEDPAALAATNLLALLLQDQGRLDEAETHLRHVLAVHRRVSSPEHPRTLLALNNLAWLLSTQGNREEAMELFEEILAIRRRVSGNNHPETLRTMVNLANALRDFGALDRAKPLAIEAVEGCRRVLGDRHGMTFYAMDRLAWLYYEMDQLTEAEALARETLAARRATLGDEHTHTFFSIDTLVTVLTDQGNYDEAIALAREALEGRRRRLGPDHAATFISVTKYTRVLQLAGRFQEAETELLSVHAALKASHGESDPRVGAIAEQLVDCYTAWNRPHQAAAWRAIRNGETCP